ncbi:hypothetical protein AFLA70_6g007501 [Aspergillus flavus AF70]|nr:hypothetical protein AFLA70_6g007501 [Aspergillus flavus AF70]
MEEEEILSSADMSTSAEEKFRSEKEWNWAEKYGSEWFILRWITRPLPKKGDGFH